MAAADYVRWLMATVDYVLIDGGSVLDRWKRGAGWLEWVVTLTTVQIRSPHIIPLQELGRRRQGAWDNAKMDVLWPWPAQGCDDIGTEGGACTRWHPGNGLMALMVDWDSWEVRDTDGTHRVAVEPATRNAENTRSKRAANALRPRPLISRSRQGPECSGVCGVVGSGFRIGDERSVW